MLMSWLKPIGLHDGLDAAGDLAGDRDVALLLPRAGLRNAGQRPQDDRRAKDDRAGALQEDLRAGEKADHDVLERRPLIFGQLHHEAAAAALEHAAAKHQRGEQRAGDAGDVEAEHHQPLQADAPGRGACSG